MIKYIITAILSAAVALAVYIIIKKASLKGRRDAIIEKAELEGENIKKEKILQAKEKFLQLKSEHEEYINKKNSEIREIENRTKQKENTVNLCAVLT